MVGPLPPLNALRAFEAAARTGSYVAAAREIGVTPAAVSQQVRNLERFLDKRLFTRLNNRVVLTDAGQAVFGGTTEALQTIAAVTERTLTGAKRPRLVISVLPSVAGLWLVPRLAAFVRREPRFRFALRVEDDPVDFDRSDIDLRLCYGSGLYPGLKTIALCADEVLPLCSPGYLARNPSAGGSGLAGIPDEDLIETDWGPGFGSLPSWDDWFDCAHMPRRDRRRGFVVGMSGLALDFAREGLGVALGQRMMARADLEAGRLVALSSVSLPLGHAYSLVIPPGRERKAGLAGLTKWLCGSSQDIPAT
ncbi:LysR substrate-binding domain-containing protein [Sulfitobacter sp. LCG007]